MTFADVLSWAPRVASAALMLALMAVLVWALSLSGGWYLPAGGAVAGGLLGWKSSSFRASKADAALEYTVRGAVLGLAILLLYQSGCTSVPQDPQDQEPKPETLVQPPSPEGS